MDPFLAEIRIFGFNFAPNGWAFCNGQILSIQSNTALFSLLGTNYGGNGSSTFGLPDFRARTAIHAGQGPGLTNRSLGEIGGASSVALTLNQIPAHVHATAARTDAGTSADPAGNIWGTVGTRRPAANFYSSVGGKVMNPAIIQSTGGSQPHNNLMPYQTFNYCIALQGIYPQRP